jgi:hypothetical protein
MRQNTIELLVALGGRLWHQNLPVILKKKNTPPSLGTTKNQKKKKKLRSLHSLALTSYFSLRHRQCLEMGVTRIASRGMAYIFPLFLEAYLQSKRFQGVVDI